MSESVIRWTLHANAAGFAFGASILHSFARVCAIP